MIMTQPLLSICVPTYNRVADLSNLLCFLRDEINGYSQINNLIEIIICDNHSTDGTESFVKDFIKSNKLKDWVYNRNNENIGLIGNLLKGLELATGKYLWWIGDDDNYKNGIINTVTNLCFQNKDFIFLNHSCTINEPWSGSEYKSILHEIGKPITDIDVIDLIRFYSGAFMYIGANIYKKELLKAILDSKIKINLAFPLYCGLYCAANGNYIFHPHVWIYCKWGDSSWIDKANIVYLFDMPYYISLMPELGYDRQKSKELYKYLYKDLGKKRLKYNIVCFLKKVNCFNLALRFKSLLIKK